MHKLENDDALLRIDSLLSVKLLVDKELEVVKRELVSCEAMKVELDMAITNLTAKPQQIKSQYKKPH